ncbi:MAG: exodeoxyribonuclease VII large subunit, partial [Victivallaceae bacterium]
EVGTLNIYRSGHVYLTLKDATSQLKCVWFGGERQARYIDLKVGDKIELFGRLTVYEVRGEYQFTIKTLRSCGIGELQRKFDELKQRLAAEGLFDQERKRQIPQMPRIIGVVTSPDGAAIRDFLQILNRRFPNVNVLIYPAQVQGPNAAATIAKGVEFFNRRGADVIVLTRGGGSMEDLWPFNEELVARSVAASRIPTISAVGHEIDYTICDFVCDMRVPTPSAAAELVIGARADFEERLKRLKRDLNRAVDYRVESLQRELRRLSESYLFREPEHLLRFKQQQLDELENRLTNLTTRYTDNLRHRFDKMSEQLGMLNPLRVLERGYAFLQIANSGEIVSSVEQVLPGGHLTGHVADGTIDLMVEKIAISTNKVK